MPIAKPVVLRRYATLLAMALGLTTWSVAAAQELSISLSVEGDSFEQGQSVAITYTLGNRGSKTVRVLKWNTPLEGPFGDPFIVMHDGAERAFLGAMVARGAPEADSWIEIAPGDSRSASLDLAEIYDLSAVGEYEVRVRRGVHHATTEAELPTMLDDLRRHDIESNVVKFRMLSAGPAPSRSAVPTAAPSALAALSFVGCSAGQQDLIREAFGGMASQAGSVASTVSGWSCTSWDASPAATTFMGATCGQQNLNQVQNVTGVTSSYASGGTVNIDCTGTNSCAASSPCQTTNNTIAFTCGPPNVYLCPNVYFGLPVLDVVQSQESTLYHELTHWAATGDYGYGCSSCENLAKNSPAEAQNNAANYEYFAAYIVSDDNPCGVENIVFSAGLAMIILLGGRRRLVGHRIGLGGRRFKRIWMRSA